MNAVLIGTCVNMRASDIEEFDERARSITYRTFVRNVGTEALKPFNEGLPKLKNDWHVSYEVGYIKGERVYCLHHSAIHHIFKKVT